MKTILRLAFYFLIFLFGFISLLQITPVQTYITKQFLTVFSERTDHVVSVSSVKITWLDRATLTDFLILDRKKDTLAYANKITFNYRISDLIDQNLLNVEDISSNQVKLRLIRHDTASMLNIAEFVNSLKKESPKDPKPVRVGEVLLDNLDFTLDDRTKTRLEGKIDLAHFKMQFSEFQLADFEVNMDSIEMQIINLVGKDSKSGFDLVEFQADLKLNNQSLNLTKLELRTPTSHISDSIKFYYNGLKNLGHFVDSVSFGLYLSNSVFSVEDLTRFIGTNNLQSPIKFDGVIWGRVGDFNMEDSRIGFGKESYIEGGISCFGLPNLKSTFALADITDSHLIPDDIEPYVGEISNNVSQLGKLDFTGSFAGFLNDFVARGDFITEKGSIHSDINLKIPDDPNDMKYSGNLELRKVDLGAFLNSRDLLQEVSLKGEINGEGITKENANFDLNAIIYNSGFNGYEYDTIRANGSFASKLFKGNFSVDDPNCRINGFADLDFNRTSEILKVNLKLESADLNKLNLLADSIVTGGIVSVDIVNLNLDQFTGRASIDSAFVRANNRRVELDSVKFTATLVDGKRKFDLNFPGVVAQLEGKFKISDAIKDLTALASDYASKIKLDDDTLRNIGNESDYEMEFFAQIDDLSRYLDSLRIPIEVPDGSFIEATFRESKNTNLFVYAQADYVKFGKSIIFNPVLEANSSRQNESGGILTNFILESDLQEFSGVPNTSNLLIEGVWFDNNIELTTSIRQDETNSNFRLETAAKLTRDSILVQMNPSEIIAFGEKWSFNQSNLITVYPDYIRIQDFAMSDETESIALEGIYSPEGETRLGLRANKLKLDKANLFSDLNIDGLLDVELNVFRENARESYRFDGGFLADNFTLNDFLFGDIRGTARWNPRLKNVYSKIEVERENFKSISLSGNYFPLKEKEQLELDLIFEEADLKMLEPLLKEEVSDLSGKAKGNLVITGNLTKPVIIGSCEVSEGKVRVKYLNTFYTFGGNVMFEPDLLRFGEFFLTDRKNALAKVSGAISHTSFQNIQTNVTLDAENFEFLNTTIIDNSLYYGSANCSGSVKFIGPLTDLLIKATVKTEKGTRFYVPISEGGELTQQEYIAFVDFNDSTKVEEKSKYSFKGLTLDFDVEVTPDAYCELIFDIKTGDIIRGRGRGNIKLTLETDGELQMFGPLEIADGAYNFTVPGFINKEFTVSPGSQITWFGDPYNAIIDLNAVYLQRASFEPLKTDENDGGGEFDDVIGMNVILNLSGGTLAPEIGFDLQIADKIDETSRRLGKLSQIVNNEQELKRQVISLLFFRRFSPLSSFTLGGGGNVGNSVSEFFSNQVSYLVSQLDENLEVEVDLASLDSDAFNTFQLRLAYTFLDGRLKVTRGGNFQNEQGTDDKLLDDLVGDWSVEYSLTKDGRLRAKVFRSANQQLSTDLGFQNYETGISLRFVHSFNELKDILTTKRREALRQRKPDENNSNLDGRIGTIY
ncbi:MAG: translocation/assembly module TamB domain-containing protein [Cyclobacteriaceae bacterium]